MLRYFFRQIQSLRVRKVSQIRFRTCVFEASSAVTVRDGGEGIPPSPPNKKTDRAVRPFLNLECRGIRRLLQNSQLLESFGEPGFGGGGQLRAERGRPTEEKESHPLHHEPGKQHARRCGHAVMRERITLFFGSWQPRTGRQSDLVLGRHMKSVGFKANTAVV